MVQLQNGRFHYNWLGNSGEEYPRYRIVKPEFEALYAEFKQFLSDEGLGMPTENQWEITYLNQIPQGGGLWNKVSSLRLLIFTGLLLCSSSKRAFN